MASQAEHFYFSERERLIAENVAIREQCEVAESNHAFEYERAEQIKTDLPNAREVLEAYDAKVDQLNGLLAEPKEILAGIRPHCGFIPRLSINEQLSAIARIEAEGWE